MVKPSESKLLGMKCSDTLDVTFPNEREPKTKRGVLSKLARVYDPLRLATPLTLVGKQIYRDACDSKIPWDANLNGKLLQRWEMWARSLSPEVVLPRSIASHQEEVIAIELHTLGDASIKGVGAAVYTVVKHSSGSTQQLVTAKSRLAKRSLALPRLEFFAAHMAANLAVNVSNALPKDQSLSIYACNWVDSIALDMWPRNVQTVRGQP